MGSTSFAAVVARRERVASRRSSRGGSRRRSATRRRGRGRRRRARRSACTARRRSPRRAASGRRRGRRCCRRSRARSCRGAPPRRSSSSRRNCGSARLRAQAELLVGDGERAAERDAGAGEVRLGHPGAAVRRERAARCRSEFTSDARPSQTSLTTIVLRSTTSTTRMTAAAPRPAAQRELHVAEEARPEQAEARELELADRRRRARRPRGTARSGARRATSVVVLPRTSTPSSVYFGPDRLPGARTVGATASVTGARRAPTSSPGRACPAWRAGARAEAAASASPAWLHRAARPAPAPHVRTACARASAGRQQDGDRRGGAGRGARSPGSYTLSRFVTASGCRSGAACWNASSFIGLVESPRHAREARQVDVEALRGDHLRHEENVGRRRRVAVGEPAARPPRRSRASIAASSAPRPRADEVLEPRPLHLGIRREELRDVAVLERLDAAVDDLDERAHPGASVRRRAGRARGVGKRSSSSSTMATDSTYATPSMTRHGT